MADQEYRTVRADGRSAIAPMTYTNGDSIRLSSSGRFHIRSGNDSKHRASYERASQTA